MNLQNNQITVGEILANPAAKAILLREFPSLNNPFLIAMAKNKTLEEVLELAKGRITEEQLNRVLQELQNC